MMKKLNLSILLTVLLSMVGARASAHDIEVANADGVTIYYVRTSYNELAVSCRGGQGNDYADEYSGNVVIPETVTHNYQTYSVTSIGNEAFGYCRNLTSVTIPNSVTLISSCAFFGCTGLTSVTIPNSVTSIGSDAFHECFGLTSVTIPNSVTSIGNAAFCQCYGLTSVTSYIESPFEINTDVFDGSLDNSPTLYVPCGKTEAYRNTAGWNVFTNIETKKKGWLFYKGLSEETMANLNADGVNWGSNGTDADGNTNNWNNLVKQDANSYWTANGQVIEELRGLKIDLGSGKSNSVHLATTKLRLTRANTIITFPQMTNGQKITIQGRSANTSATNRGITPVQSYIQFLPEESSPQTDGACIFLGSQVEGSDGTYTFVWEVVTDEVGSVDVQFKLTPEAGIDFNYFIIDDGEDIMAENADGVTIYYERTSKDNELAVSCRGVRGNDYPDEYSGNVVIPETVTFDNKTYSVTSIGDEAFMKCTGLTSVTIPSSVTSIGEKAFATCSGLTSVTIPNSVTSIGYGAFGLSGLTSVTIPNSVTSIGDIAFTQCYDLISVTIGNSVTSIGERTFRYCGNLSSVTIGNNVTSIGKEAFYDCRALNSLTIPNSVTSIGELAFCFCDGLTSVTIPNSVTSIGADAFWGCTGLTSITIPSSVESIGSGAFGSCDNLKEVFVEVETPLAIDENTFSSRASATLYVPYGCKAAYESADYWREFSEIVEAVRYTVNEWVNDQIVNTTEGTGWPYYEVTVPYHRYNVVDNMLYKRNVTKKEYNHKFLLLDDNQTEDLYYEQAEIENVVFLTEAEDLEGMSICNNDNARVRSSNAAAAYPTDGNVALVTLPAGKYQLTAVMFSSLKSPYYQWTFLAGDNAIATLDNTIVNRDEKSTEPFVLTKETTIYVQKNGNDRNGLDLVYIQEILEDTDISLLDNVIYLEPTEVKANSEATLSLKMKNSAKIRGFQFDLYLPDGVTVVKSSKGRIMGQLSEGRLPEEDEHTLSLSEQPDGAIRFLCSSQYDDTFTGTDGEIVTLQVSIPNDMTFGDHFVELKDIRLTETNISKYYDTPLVRSRLIVSALIPGDINGDNLVDISDYTGVANHIHGITPAGFLPNAADVDESGKIDVSDYTGIANIIHTGSIYGNSAARLLNAPALRVNTDVNTLDNVIYVEPFTAEAGTEGQMTFAMKNTADIRGFQFDLYLPEGVSVVKSSKGRIVGELCADRLPEDDEHELSFSEQADGAIRFLCSSLYDETFTGNDGPLVTLKVAYAADMAKGDYPIAMRNVKLTENDISLFYLTEYLESTLTIGAAAQKGDVNGDGQVGIGDIVAVTNFMAGNAGGVTSELADVNGDGDVGIGDIVAITNIMAGADASRQR